MDALPSIPNICLEPTAHGRLLVYFSYHPENIRRIKTISGRRWHGEKNAGACPLPRLLLIG